MPGRANRMGKVRRGLDTAGGELSRKLSVTVSVLGSQMGK